MRVPYQPRTIRFVELHQADGWRLKVYSILHRNKQRDPELLVTATDTALAWLPRPAVTSDRYGVGLLGVHQGSSYDFVTVGYWAYETELRFQTYMRPSTVSYRLEPIGAEELSTDVWDIELLAFERDAWMETVLLPDEGDLEGDVDRYLARRLDVLV